ncbi:MAG: iron chelate uptake ABC transporter family permease subunit, partial [Pseudomonadota bacterium]
MRPAALLPLLLLAACGLFALALATGTQGFTPGAAWQALTGTGSMERDVILALRLPRALAAFGCGALLALAGALLQALLRNPLADPFVLGISGGAGTAMLLAMFVGLGGFALGLAGLAGAGL